MTHDTLLARHGEALELFTEHVHAIGRDQWRAPTPCADWTVRDLVNHLTAEQLWVPFTVGGATMAEVGDRFDGDRLGDHPTRAWDHAVAGALAAFREPGALDRTVHLSYGPSPCAAYCSQMTADATVHAWDLARAIGADETIPKTLLDFTQGEFGAYADDLAGTGLFAPPVEPPPGADAQTVLLAQLGRRV
ncbi:TIGR03086 family metal-binding protein [Streptomyces gamaensis]|uniref:TIGR03086 family metal-binding protein n=1 Tax=Streptomyces gamaensis TaxID=1763542 RepID=A0ABW0YVR3_9ACTN